MDHPTPLNLDTFLQPALDLHDQAMELERRSKDVNYRAKLKLSEIQTVLSETESVLTNHPLKTFLILKYGMSVLNDPKILESFEQFEKQIAKALQSPVLFVRMYKKPAVHAGPAVHVPSRDMYEWGLCYPLERLQINWKKLSCIIKASRIVYPSTTKILGEPTNIFRVDMDQLIANWDETIRRSTSWAYTVLFGETDVRNFAATCGLSEVLQEVKQS